MSEETDDKFRMRHPTSWTVEALLWEYKEHDPEDSTSHILPGPGVQMAKRVAIAEVPDRSYAVAIAHHYLDRHAEEAVGRMSLEIHIHPSKRDLEGTYYEVTEEALEQARQLGIKDEEEVRRMARDATPLAQPNLRHGRYFLRVEDDDLVSWIGLEEPRGRRKGK